MGKTKLQEFVLSFGKERRDNYEILIEISNLDQARQVIEMMNKIGNCRNYNAWIDPKRSSGLNGFKSSKSTHLLIDIRDKSVSYSGKRKISELVGTKMARIHADDYTVKRERKKLIL
jgi:hypothetical protein